MDMMSAQNQMYYINNKLVQSNNTKPIHSQPKSNSIKSVNIHPSSGATAQIGPWPPVSSAVVVPSKASV
jgi:hypothetical protein